MGWKDFFKPDTVKMRIGDKLLRIKDCKGIFSLFGLMFDGMDSVDGALIYANNVWMPFVKKRLDILFLDDSFRVIDIKEAFPFTLNPRTWTVYKNRRAKFCLEIKKGLIKKGRLISKRLYLKL